MSNRKAFILVVSLFFMWGFITVIVDAFIPRLKDVFELSYLQAGLVQFAWFTAYGLLGIPGGLLIKKIGYQKGIIVALSICALGCLLFWPAAHFRVFGFFLSALFVLAGGITVLQVAANPYIAVLGEARLASSRLNLAQAINSFGTTIAPIFAATYLLSDTILSQDEQIALSETNLEAYRMAEAGAVKGPFLALAAVFGIIALFFLIQRLPKIINPESKGSYVEVFQNTKLKVGALLIFLYVGTEVAIGSFIVNYGLSIDIHEVIKSSPQLNKLSYFAASIKGMTLDQMNPKAIIGALVTLYWGGAMIGRFIGSYLTAKFPPHRILAMFAVIAALLVLQTISSFGIKSFLFLLAIGFFNSIMFPTIFTLAIDDLGEQKPQGSGILVTAICGGAFIPPAVGAIADVTSFPVAFILPLICYVIIAGLANHYLGQASN
ncbi:MAG: sugar MFS transporter [Chitinophagales bacterium]